MQFEGKLIKDDQQVADITGNLQRLSSQGGVLRWSGNFRIPAGFDPSIGQEFRLELDDGRSGDILIEKVRRGAGVFRIAQFRVNGDWQGAST